jgi:hypothetical protein
VNLEGFSRTRGFELFLGALFGALFGALREALRMVRGVEGDAERRVRHNALLCGSRNRGIDVGGGIA